MNFVCIGESGFFLNNRALQKVFEILGGPEKAAPKDCLATEAAKTAVVKLVLWCGSSTVAIVVAAV